MPNAPIRTGAAPAAVELVAQEFGGHIAEARKRRRWTQEELARKAGITRQTLMKIERGNLGTALTAYIAVLWAMGLHHSFAALVAAERDPEGQALERSRLGARIRHGHSADDDF
jgi:transcriptional regulator with XRE-family HTH domain